MNLKGKKLALVCPKFYGYEHLIAEELKNRGAEVYLIYENIEWVKLSYRLVYAYLPGFKDKLIRHYYHKRLGEIIHSLDMLIAIRASSLNSELMEWIKKEAPDHCRYVLYQWDGVKNNPAALDIAPYFDRVMTFDQTDAEKYRWVYRPLFFVPEYIDDSAKKDIDILFICALHSSRAKVLNQLKPIAAEKGCSLKVVMHLNRFLYYKYKYLNRRPEVVDAQVQDLTFKPLSIKESYQLYSRSKVVVDCTNKNQTGLTMRTIESLGNRCKLATNNALIQASDFYTDKNIHVYNEDHLTLPDHFISEPYAPVNPEVYENYTLHRWVDDLIDFSNA